jgi:Cu-Zn family superoxide dismutase
MRLPLWILASTLCLPLAAHADDVTVDISEVTPEAVGATIGTARLVDSNGGLKIIVNIDEGLEDGLHGFHIHQNPSCDPAETEGEMSAAGAAGDHFDPEDSGKHMGPSGNGHQGDLPVISIVNGRAEDQVLWAPRLTVADVRGHALMIHAGGDNYRDTPEKLGGGGDRVACGVFPS